MKCRSLTEFTENVCSCLETGCIPFMVTRHAPHPPSRHINLVPLSFALFRMNEFKDVSIRMFVELTKQEEIRYTEAHTKLITPFVHAYRKYLYRIYLISNYLDTSHR